MALTALLLEKGWRVVGVSRRDSARVDSAYVHHVADVCASQYEQSLRAIIAREGQLDACVYCAGIGEVLDLQTFANERAVFDTNLIGAVRTAQVIIPAMVGAKSGHFIGLSSQGDRVINPAAPSYGASKAGLSAYLEGLAPACRREGVRVTNVRFGFVDTKMAKSPHRPFMISAKQAALRVWKCIEQKPVRHTFPKRMAVLLWVIGLGSWVRRWFS